MAGGTSTVVVIRVWNDEGRIGGRVLFERDDDDEMHSRVADSLEQLRALTAEVLTDWVNRQGEAPHGPTGVQG